MNKKRFGSIILAFVLALAMSITAFAANGQSNITGSTTNHSSVTSGSTFILTKKIALFNTGSSQIYEPNVKYTYAIANVNPGSATVTDGTHTAVVKQGMGGVSIAYTEAASGATDGIAFGQTDAKFNTNAENTVDNATDFQSRTATISVNTSVFKNASNQPQPGIYRYSITETMEDSVNGVVHNVTEPLYLDVYVRFNSGGTGLEVYGFALFRDTSSVTEKVTGFDDSSAGNALVDEYHTYNSTITKTVSGSIGDKNNNFPFQAALAGTNGNAELYYVATMDGTAGSAQKVTLSSGVATIGSATADGAIKLQHNDTLVITGIPVATTVDVTEYNNTADTYTASLPSKTAGNAATVAISNTTLAASGTVKTDAALTVVGSAAGSYGNTAVTFNNELAEVSPTNVILRFAPYMMLAGLALALMLAGISKKRSGNNISNI